MKIKIFLFALIVAIVACILSILLEFLSDKAYERKHNLLGSIFSFLYLISLFTFVISFIILVIIFDFILIN